jgi:hypothetical protein
MGIADHLVIIAGDIVDAAHCLMVFTNPLRGSVMMIPTPPFLMIRILPSPTSLARTPLAQRPQKHGDQDGCAEQGQANLLAQHDREEGGDQDTYGHGRVDDPVVEHLLVGVLGLIIVGVAPVIAGDVGLVGDGLRLPFGSYQTKNADPSHRDRLHRQRILTLLSLGPQARTTIGD